MLREIKIDKDKHRGYTRNLSMYSYSNFNQLPFCFGDDNRCPEDDNQPINEKQYQRIRSPVSALSFCVRNRVPV